MIADLLRSGLYQEIENLTTHKTDLAEKNSNPLSRIALRYLPEAKQCPRCQSPNIVKKTISKRVVLDIIDNRPIEVTILKQRYKCKNCGHTFVVKDALDYPEHMHVTTAALDRFATQILDDPEIVISTFGEQFQIGRTTISEAVQKKIQELSKQTSSVAPCIYIYYVPFYFTGKERCAIVGVDENECELLLDILEEYSPRGLESFFPKTYGFKDDIELLFCKLEAIFVKLIREQFKTDVAILRSCIQKELQKAKEDQEDGLYNKKLDALYNLKFLIEKSGEMRFRYDFVEWFENLTEPLQQSFKPLFQAFLECIKEDANIVNYYTYEPSMKKLMEIISKYRKDHASFTTMAFRLLYANRVALSSPNGSQIFRSISSMMAPTSGSMTAFGVDINRLYEEVIQDEM